MLAETASQTYGREA